MSFKKAERKRAKLKIGISGPSGSGKTFSALQLAKGIGGRVAVIDTENDSSSLYADQFDFDVLNIEAPFTTDKYIAAMKLAEKGNYDITIIDSATHQWMGEGGLYERKTKKDARGGNSFTNWSEFTPEHSRFLNSIVQHNTHLIVTVRSKQDYAVSEKGRPEKLGLAPVQREGWEYEFTTMFDIAMNHSAQVSKDRTGLFDGKLFTVSEDTGLAFMKWLSGAKEIQPDPKPEDSFDNFKDGPISSPPAQSGVGVHCSCQLEVKLHPSGKGYFCPNFKTGEGHLKFPVNELQQYLAAQVK